jgi:hypothetical protein
VIGRELSIHDPAANIKRIANSPVRMRGIPELILLGKIEFC